MSKTKLNDTTGTKLEIGKVADMCRIKTTDTLTNEVTVLMLTEVKLQELINKLQQFKKNNFV